jgi:hypothetical protein
MNSFESNSPKIPSPTLKPKDSPIDMFINSVAEFKFNPLGLLAPTLPKLPIIEAESASATFKPVRPRLEGGIIVESVEIPAELGLLILFHVFCHVLAFR